MQQTDRGGEVDRKLYGTMFVSEGEEQAGWQQTVKVNHNPTPKGEKLSSNENQVEARADRKQAGLRHGQK